MSGTWTRVPVVVDQDRRTDGAAEIGADPVEELITRVLGRAHRAAEDLDAPNQARTILMVAHSFADELAATNPRFDRLRFIEAATTAPS